MTFSNSAYVYKLEELCESIQDGDWIETKDQSSEGYRLLQIGNVAVGKFRESGKPRYVSEDTFHRLNCTKIEIGDVLIARMPEPTGRAWCVDAPIPDSITSVDVAIVRVDPAKLDAKYLAYFLNLKSTLQLMAGLQTGSTRQRIKRSDLCTLEILTHQLDTQKAIAEFFTNLDQKIALNEVISKTLEDIAQTIFKSWFIDFDPVKAKMAGEKPAGMDAATAKLFPDSMEESELGLIPKGWRIGTLGEIADLQGGYAFKSSSWTESGVPVIKIGSVKPGFVDLTQVSYVDASTAEAIPDDYRIPAGSLVVGLTGYVGQVGLVRTHDPIPLVNQRVAKFKHKSGEWKIPFIYCFTRGEKFKGIVEELATGTAQQNVSNSQILSIPLTIPSQEIQNIFENSLNSFFHQMINLADENESLKSTRDALLPRLISGELQIPKEMLAS